MSETSNDVDRTQSPGAKSLVQLYESKKTSANLIRGTHSVRYVNDRVPSHISTPKPALPIARSNTTLSTISGARVAASKSATVIDATPVPQLRDILQKFREDPVSLGTTAKGSHVQPRPLPLPQREKIEGHAKSEEERDHDMPPSTRRKEPEVRSQSQRQGSPPALAPKIIYPKPELPSRAPQSLKPAPTSSFTNRPLPRQQYPERNQLPDRVKSAYVPPTNPYSASRNMSVDSLANAIVASSLASSRASSPSKVAAPPPPLPRRHHLFHRNTSQELISRTPSPGKTMRQTMRKPVSSEDESEIQRREKGKGHLVRKHPNKHHEGDRKRWRTQVTERERKRYEGVWAANRGLLMPETTPGTDEDRINKGLVLNIVVGDIWRRSRLPNTVLAEIWNLVSRHDRDTLDREEFVVGMWLIDQRLRGNKLPVKVSKSVWASVRMLEGIKLSQDRP